MHLGNSIQAHNDWKTKFRSAIANRETLVTAAVSADNCCELGRWLHGEGKRLFGELPHYMHCVVSHSLFHQEAGKIAELINARNFADAEGLLAAQAPFSTASNTLTTAILRLKKDAANSPGVISLIAKLSEYCR